MNFATMKLMSALPFLFPLFALAIESFDHTQHESSSTSEGSGQKKRDLLSIVCPNPPCEVPTASIVGRAFFDTNGDGIDNDPDNAIAGVTVRLEDPTSQLIATTLTGSDGSYSFGNRSGNFVIRPDIRGLITIFKGFEEGGNDIDPITGLSEQFIVFSSDETINIGVVALIATLPPPFVATFAPTPSPTPEPTEDPCFFRSDDNLLCNGSFELNAVPSGELIRFPEDQVPGWNSLGDIICLNNNVGNVQAADGTKYAELDCIAGGSIEGLYQDVVTVPGVEYTLSFKMRSRDPNKAFTEDEGVNVEWNGSKITPTSILAPTQNWEQKVFTVIGTGFDRILFRESIVSSGNDGSGPYIDEVVLKELVATPSPTSAPCVRTDTNLLCNGSFELNDVNSGSMGIFLEDNVSGWSSASGGFVCLINDLNIAAPNGQNYLALDCRAGGDIEGVFQDVPTVPGQEYRLTWKMRPADPNRFDLEDEGVNVEWNGVKVQPTSYFASDSSGVWETKEAFVTGTGGNDRLLIRESVTPGASDGSGPLIDDVILSPTLCSRSESNWICNGSFEFNEVPSGRVEIFTNEMVTGWTSNTGNICIGNDLFNTIAPDLPVAAPDGSNYLTLDCSASGDTEGIYQDIPTISGQKYRLTWKMRPQDPSRFDLEDEGVNIEWNGRKLQPTSFFVSDLSGTWEMKEAVVVGTGGDDRLLIRESKSQGASDGSGPWVDDIVLKKVHSNLRK